MAGAYGSAGAAGGVHTLYRSFPYLFWNYVSRWSGLAEAVYPPTGPGDTAIDTAAFRNGDEFACLDPAVFGPM